MSKLYHYTSLTGLMGIVESRNVWATHASFLNDSSEYLHGLSFAKEMASAIYATDDYLGAFGYLLKISLEGISANDLYVTSFSEKSDLLSQWRGYCPPGAGVCIGFDFDSLKDFCKSQDCKLEKCVYDHEEQINQIQDLVYRCMDGFPQPALKRSEYELLTSEQQAKFSLDYFNQLLQGPAGDRTTNSLGRLCTEIAKRVPLFKHEGFHEEAEWRIITNASKHKAKFRGRSSYLAAYVELEILGDAKNAALTEVIIGPNPNQQRCEESVGMLLAANGFCEVEVKCSPLPYNSW